MLLLSQGIKRKFQLFLGLTISYIFKSHWKVQFYSILFYTWIGIGITDLATIRTTKPSKNSKFVPQFMPLYSSDPSSQSVNRSQTSSFRTHYTKRSLMSWVVVIPKEGWTVLLVWHRLFRIFFEKNFFWFFFFFWKVGCHTKRRMSFFGLPWPSRSAWND